MRVSIPSILLLVALLAACAESPTGRRQLLLFSEGEMSKMGVTAFNQMKQELPVEQDSATNRYVTCVADAITSTMAPPMNSGWEVRVFKDDSANAFALPGQKIGVHNGMLKVATTQDQLAAVIGHEIGHVTAHHSAERMSIQFVSQSSQQLVGAMVGGSETGNAVMSVLGVGAQYGVVLPYSRTQEAEADRVGMELMAQAGFDPRSAVRLWLNMSEQSEGQPPEFMSTHPSHETRINGLQSLVPKVDPIYQQARQAGRRPNCKK